MNFCFKSRFTNLNLRLEINSHDRNEIGDVNLSRKNTCDVLQI